MSSSSRARNARNAYMVTNTVDNTLLQPSNLQVYELLKHEWLRLPDSVELLKELRGILATMPAAFLPNTVDNYRMQMLVSGVLVSAKQCPALHATLERAKLCVQKIFGPLAENAMKAQMFTTLDSGANASSLSLPLWSAGAHESIPVIVVTDTFVQHLTPRQLEAVLIHELAHILYTDCEAVVAMKTVCALQDDSTLAGSLLAQIKLEKFKVIQAGFELTADRVMCHCMPEHWADIVSMFTTLAGGSVGEPLQGSAFLEQLKLVNTYVKDSMVLASINKNPHPPIGVRVMELQRFRKSLTAGV
jgi:hypothetical protein